MTSTKNDTSVSFITSTINARYWLLPAIWVEAGVGHGHARVSYGPLSVRASDDVPVAQLGAGLELVQIGNVLLDLHLKVAQGTSTNDDSGAVTTGRSFGAIVGATYYSRR